MPRQPADPEAKRAALTLLKRGKATPGEVAVMAGVSRQTVESWARHAGVDLARLRAKQRQALARTWRALLTRGD